MPMTRPRILYLDAHDSFSNNIISLLREHLDAGVETIKIDDARFVLNDDAFLDLLDGFDAVVAGPGPGHPALPADVGLIARLWTLPDDRLLPVLGICLGFQSLCLACGAGVERLRAPRHGLVTPVTHCDRDVFSDTGAVQATQYHSLHVRLGPDAPTPARGMWTPSSCFDGDLVPLAWDLSDDRNGPILMAVKHCRKPFHGVQFHPESICSNDEGRRLIRSWWREACRWRGSDITELVIGPGQAENKGRVDSVRTSEDVQGSRVHWGSSSLPPGVDVVDLVDSLREDCVGVEPILLESGTRDGAPVNAETGRFSIIGLPNATSTRIRYSVRSGRLSVEAGGETLLESESTIAEVFDYLEQFITDRKAVGGPDEVPFWGGLVGYISYEAGLETIAVDPAAGNEGYPDVSFVLVERSVVVDHVGSKLCVMSLGDDDDDWTQSTTERLRGVATRTETSPSAVPSAEVSAGPMREAYCDRVRDCQARLRAGESYELCLTDTTCIRSDEDSWSFYRRLRERNPAPFGAHINLADTPSATSLYIASSSPERFLSWTRDGHCQFRPIKGTVKKTPGVTKEAAEEILRSPKEQAENLMIVDLIRHDLSGVKGVSNVRVPKLMSVEEYATVYQLVSIVSGTATNPHAVLAASLPPGSMTGAPKKRSCELLRGLEGSGANDRGIYSGVVGYLDVGGGGDFSVAIRTAFKWGDEDCWRVGAGGAVTVLSDAGAEWEEMVAKRESVLRAFALAG